MKKLIAALFTIVLSASFLQAQEPTPSPTPGRVPPIWEVSLPGGSYAVKINYMTSVSMHEYVVDGAARVTEVNIGTVGSDLVRFYYIEANIPKPPVGQSVINEVQDKINEGTTRAGLDDSWQKVVKSYPTTTHAHTVEFRLPSKAALQKIYESASRAFKTATAASIKS